MESHNIYWGSNLKFLRLRMELSQDSISSLLNISRDKYAKHETGVVKNPSMDDLFTISTFFKINIDSLIKVDLSKLEEKGLMELEKDSNPKAILNPDCRTFRLVEDSMLPYASGNDIIAQRLDDWTTIKNRSLCVLIMKESEDIVFKQVSWLTDGILLLESLNKNYETYKIEQEHIHEIWVFKKYSINSIDVQTATLQKVVTMIKELKSEIRQLKNTNI